MQSARPVPVEAADGRDFTLTRCEPLQTGLLDLDRALGGSLALPDELSHAAGRERFRMDALVEESIRSSQLEGASTSRHVAEEMLRSGRRPRDHSERMILNNFTAMERVRERAGEPVTPELLLDLHRIVADGTLRNPADAGRFRTDDAVRVVGPDGVVSHVPPPARELPARMGRLCDLANGVEPRDGPLHPLVRAILLHFAMGYHHPFADGNGRVARALFYGSLLRSGWSRADLLSVSSILRRSPARYARAYEYCESDRWDATYFVLFHLDVVRRAVSLLLEHVARTRDRIGEARELLRDDGFLNERQTALVARALDDPGGAHTFRSHGRSCGVVFDTARRDLLGLEGMGLLLRSKRGREFVFRPPADLERRLRGLRKGR